MRKPAPHVARALDRLAGHDADMAEVREILRRTLGDELGPPV
jgi:hypothetical protein